VHLAELFTADFSQGNLRDEGRASSLDQHRLLFVETELFFTRLQLNRLTRLVEEDAQSVAVLLNELG